MLVIVTAMYPSEGVCMSFHSGYSPSDKTGIVTKVDGRTLYEIDGKPAAEVYNKWTNGAVDEFMNGGNVLAATSLYPIGRVAGKMGEIDYHRLSHPETVTADGALTLFSVMEKGKYEIIFEMILESYSISNILSSKCIGKVGLDMVLKNYSCKLEMKWLVEV